MAVNYDLGTARGTIELDASSLGRASAALTTVGAGMTAVGVLAVGGLLLAAKSSANLEKTLSAVKAVTNATGAEMDILREKALTLATGGAFSANEIARAFEDLGKAGITVREITGGAAEAVVKLAAAAGDELPGGIAQGAEIIANAMKTFEVSADQAGHFADVLVAAAASSTLSVDDMATSFRYAGPIAHELGLSIDDLSGVLAILGDRGIKGSTAGTSLRGVLLSLTPTSVKATNAMKALGLITENGKNQFYDMHGALKPIPEVMQILQNATKNLSEEQKVQAFNTIFQRRAMNAALILADQGAAGFDKYATSIKGLTAADIAAEKLNNLHGDMTKLKNTVDVLIKRAGRPLQDMLRGWVQGLTKVVDKLSKVNPETLSTALKIIAVTGAVIGALGVVALFASALLKMYTLFVNLKAALSLLIGAFRLLSVTLLTNPVFLIVAAIVALGAALYYAYQKSVPFRKFVDETFAKIKTFAIPIIRDLIAGWRALIENFKNPGSIRSGGIVEFLGQIGTFARKAFEAVKSFLYTLRSGFTEDEGTKIESVALAVRSVAFWLKDNLIPALVATGKWIVWFNKEAIERLISALKFIGPVILDVIKWLGWLGGEVISRIASGFQWLQKNVFPIFTELGALIVAVVQRIIQVVQFLQPVWSAAWDIILAVLKVAWEAIKAVFDIFINIVTTIWRNFGDNLWSLIQLAFNIIKTIVENALQIIKGIIQLVTGIISGDWGKAWEGIKNIFGGIWDIIKAIPGVALEAIKIVIETAFDTILSLFQIFWNALKAICTALWNSIKAIFQGAIDAIVGIFKWLYNIVVGHSIIPDLMRAILDWFLWLPNKVVGVVKDFAENAIRGFQRLKDGAIDMVRQLIDNIMGIRERILGAIGDLGGLLYNAGRSVIEGLIRGIKSMIGAVGDAVSGIAGAVTSHFPNSPQAKRGPLHDHNPEVMGARIVKSLSKGMLQELAQMARVSSMIAGATAASAMTSGTTNNSPVSVNFVFPGVTSSRDAEELKKSLNDPTVLAQLTRSLKAGVGRN